VVANQKILVMSGIVPGDDGVGAILLKQILELLPRDQLKIITFKKQGSPVEKAKRSCWSDLQLNRRYEPAYKPVNGLVGEAISFMAHVLFGLPHLNRLKRACIQAGEDFACTAVFAVMDNPTVIRIATSVSKRLEVPLFSFVMDGPMLEARNYFYGPCLTRGLIRSFDEAMHHSEQLAVAGETMQLEYDKRYGKTSIIFRQGVPDFPDASPASESSPSEILRIGFAGSMTARDTYEHLIAELDRRSWQLGGKQIVLRIIGAHLKLVPTGPQNIEYFGWRSIPEMIKLTAECDFLYLPQSFEPSLREFTELSFPNKLCTYLPARRPILLHTPVYGSLNQFFQEFSCGPVSNTLHAEDILKSVEHLMECSSAVTEHQQAIESAFSYRLNHACLAENVAKFFDRPITS